MESRICKKIIILIFGILLLSPSSVTAFETDPVDGETDFPVNGKIIIEFNYSMDIATVDVALTPDLIYPFVPKWTNNNHTLTLKPTVSFMKDKRYTIHVTGDYENNTHGSVNETFSFTTEIQESSGSDEEEFRLLAPIIVIVLAIIMVIIFLRIIKKEIKI